MHEGSADSPVRCLEKRAEVPALHSDADLTSLSKSTRRNDGKPGRERFAGHRQHVQETREAFSGERKDVGESGERVSDEPKGVGESGERVSGEPKTLPESPVPFSGERKRLPERGEDLSDERKRVPPKPPDMAQVVTRGMGMDWQNASGWEGSTPLRRPSLLQPLHLHDGDDPVGGFPAEEEGGL